MTRRYIRKLTKQGRYSYYLILPKRIMDQLNWRERQKLTIRKYGQGIMVKDWKKKQWERGFTFVDLLVGVALLSIVFLGIFGAYRLGLKVVGQSKNKITATAIANAELEKIRNLPYASIGLPGGSPAGTVAATGEQTINNVTYLIERNIDYVADPADGLAAPEDSCVNDYKKAGVTVSWSGNFAGQVALSTDVAPANLAQECADSGGVLSVQVFDAYGILVPSPLIEIKSTGDALLESRAPSTGQHNFTLNEGTYKVVVSKVGYSSEQTFGSGDGYNGKTIVTPEKPHLVVLDGQLTEASFSIDRVGSFAVDTLSPWGEDFFSDSFVDQSKISELSNVIVSGGQVTLDPAATVGFITSATTSPTTIINWERLSFTDEEPVNTDLRYRLYYYASPDWVLIPDADLPGNSLGFDDSPVDLTGLNPATYPEIKVRADFSATAAGLTPTLYDWQIAWRTSNPTPIGNALFHLQGQKIVGQDAAEQPIYKYSQDHTSDGSGHIDISNLEWDAYTFSVDPAAGLDLVNIDPSPQPIALLPNVNVAVKLYLDSENSLLVTVQNDVTLEPIFSASARLYNTGLGYDATQYTNENGQTYFIPLEPATYNLDVQAAGYSDVSTQVTVSGDNTFIVNMTQVE